MVNVKRYVAKTAREALAALKADLGPDAVVLSNRAVADGVEIVALPAGEMGALSATVRQARAPSPVPAPPPAVARPIVAPPVVRPTPAPLPEMDDDESDFTVTLGEHIARLQREAAPGLRSRTRPGLREPASVEARVYNDHEQSQANPPSIRAFTPPRVTTQGEPLVARPVLQPRRDEPVATAVVPVEQDVAREAKVQVLEATNARLMDELASLKGMLERQLAGFAWNEMSRNAPGRTQMMSELLEAGFSSQLTRTLTEGLGSEETIAETRNQVRQRLNRMMPLLDSDADIIDKGGVYALVGPTGVGKTTTTAKLAARCVVRHGADKLALITTDGYRIGAHEQLRIYGRILGVTVHVVRDAADLRQTLQDLRKKHMVLIDTIGMSQRDKMVVEQASMLTSAGCVRRLLVLNATARGDTLDDVVRAYDGPDLAGCILSKVDEAASLAPALDVAVRHELQMFYVANGQRVPEDLHLPNRAYLIHRAMRESGNGSPYKLDAADACVLMTSPPVSSAPVARGL